MTHEVLLLGLVAALAYLFVMEGRTTRKRPGRPVRLRRSEEADAAQPEDERSGFANQRKIVSKHVIVHGNTSEFCLDEVLLSNLVAVEVVAANFPRAQYLVDEHNCWLDYWYQLRDQRSFTHSVRVDLGNHHTAASLAAELSHKSNLTFSYDPRTATFEVRGGTPPGAEPCDQQHIRTDVVSFRLLFGSGPHARHAMCRELGFICGEDTAPVPSLLVAPYRTDLTGARFLHVACKQLDQQKNRGVLAQIPMVPPAPFAVYAPGSVETRWLDAPITVRKLNLRILDYDAAKGTLEPYNFRGMYWSLTLKIVTLEPMAFARLSESNHQRVRPVYTARPARPVTTTLSSATDFSRAEVVREQHVTGHDL